jgi:hypothetical protein
LKHQIENRACKYIEDKIKLQYQLLVHDEVKAAQSLKKKLNKQNNRTLVYAVSESHRITTLYKKEKGLDTIGPNIKNKIIKSTVR